MKLLIPFPSLTHSAVCHHDDVLLQQVIAGRCLLGKMYWHERLEHGDELWNQHADAAAVYLTLCLLEMKIRGLDTYFHVAPFTENRCLDVRWMGLELVHQMERAIAPSWLGDERVHCEHRKQLSELRPEYYSKFWRI